MGQRKLFDLIGVFFPEAGPCPTCRGIDFSPEEVDQRIELAAVVERSR